MKDLEAIKRYSSCVHKRKGSFFEVHSMRKFLKWSDRHSGLISVVGALILFFSWVVSNTMKDEATSAKAVYEHALERSETDAILQGLSSGVGSLQQPYLSDPRGEPTRLDKLRIRFNRIVLESQAVRGLSRNLPRLEQMTRSFPGSALRSDVQAHLKNVQPVVNRLQQYSEAAERRVLKIQKPGTEMTDEEYKLAVEATDALEKIVAEQNADPNVDRLAAQAFEIQQRAINDLHTSYVNADQRAKVAKNVTFVLYVLGTCVALFGQVLDKGKFFKDEMDATAQSPSKKVAKKAKQR